MRDDPEEFDDELEEGPSKTEIKRQMLALQALGEKLTRLKDKELARIPIEDDRLMEAILESRNIRSNNARKRHLQFIGKLMRDVDPTPIENALEALHKPAKVANEKFHELEALRDDVLAAGVNGVEKVMAKWPDADRQQLRQLVLQAQREKKNNKPPAASRKLFRYLRELQEHA
ncbi:hypothetical protein BST95_17730 [Halioglobus japonicus]|uniref:Dual-action ribosomal maturation protein DarP n=1 Tax=Halioglobus japonicus TaxID=930805 RepID=A0AAP8MFW0_9GAMM|nr:MULTISPECIES: ribosome biogenesis factor YjgA [Halioglobus]AQA19812.1 hypothetical protein BST95_17730 [Halioglobus japonicus]KZX59534.1 hypothetical protein A3709_14710 [Halioglobus sp. HI00S01]PLW87113.1 DUF615 domain-containing protein [Halioglobus japonicus]GHD10126.1 hypothetical protein GCM10007052_09060 [Halioglobus japonicus]